MNSLRVMATLSPQGNLHWMTWVKSGQGALYEASAKWYDIGIELKFSIGTLDTIRKNFPHAAEYCLRELCIRWLKCTEPRPTWTALTKALESAPVGEGHLAQQLRDKYCPGREDMIPHVYPTPGLSPPGAPPTSQGNTLEYSSTDEWWKSITY